MIGGLKAGFAYFGLVFAAGFVLGALRELVVAPVWGAEAARYAELPVMVTLSALFARLCVRHFALECRGALICGLTGYLLLQLGELALAEGLARGGASRYLADVMTLAGSIAFAAQALVAVLPLVFCRSTRNEQP